MGLRLGRAVRARQTHVLLRRFAETVDGEYQNLGANDGDYNRAKFFDRDPEFERARRDHDRRRDQCAEARRPRLPQALRRLRRRRGARGPPDRDPRQDQEGLRHGRGRRVAHDRPPVEEARRRGAAGVPRPLRPAARATRTSRRSRSIAAARTAPEMRYLSARRAALGGFLPARRRGRPRRPAVPPLDSYAGFATAAGGKEMSTTMAAVRMLSAPFSRTRRSARASFRSSPTRRAPSAWPRLFRQIGIYAPQGQLYEPEDAGSLLSYREARDGQLLEEGITEAGAISSWTAAATAYSVHGLTDAAVLYLLLDVRLPAGRRPHLGGGRPAGARLPDRRDRRPHDARRGGAAAPGRREPRRWRR